MWGIIPAAGKGSRIQPLAFSKELLPIGAGSGADVRTPRAVSDFLMERLAIAGVRRICFVISADKSDILEYYGGSAWSASICYTVQPKPAGLCDAIFRALPVIDPNEPVFIGLPDTIWFPAEGYALLPEEKFSMLLFPVEEPQFFDSVEFEPEGRVRRIRVKDKDATSHWIWGAFRLPGSTYIALYNLWMERGCIDEYFGTLVNAWIDRGGEVWGITAGTSYYDVGTMDGYMEAIRMLSGNSEPHEGRRVA